MCALCNQMRICRVTAAFMKHQTDSRINVAEWKFISKYYCPSQMMSCTRSTQIEISCAHCCVKKGVRKNDDESSFCMGEFQRLQHRRICTFKYHSQGPPGHVLQICIPTSEKAAMNLYFKRYD